SGQRYRSRRSHGVIRCSASMRTASAGPPKDGPGVGTAGRWPRQSARCSVQRLPSHHRMGAWLHGSGDHPGGGVLICSPKTLASGARWCRRGSNGSSGENGASRLLELDGGAGLFELGLGLVGVFLGDLLDDGLRGGVDEVLGLLETQAGELAHHLDDLDLLLAGGGEDDVELVLLLSRGGLGSTTAGGRSGGHRHGGGGGDAELLL